MKKLIIILSVLALSGCSVDPDRMAAANEAGAAYWMQYNQQQLSAPVASPMQPVQHSQMLYQMMHSTTTITPTYNGGYMVTTN